MLKLESSQRMTFTGRRFPDGQMMAIWVDDGKITGDEPIQVLDTEPEVERWIVPGFFDMQVNGFAGQSFLEADLSVNEIETAAEAMFRTGVTRFLPTIITGGLDDMCRQLATLAEAIERIPLLRAMCPGIHVEGPFIHPEDGPRGAHPREHVREPNLADFQRLFTAARGRMSLITLAPDRPGALEVIRAACALGVLVSLGHHRADRAVLAAAVEAGARMSTHLGNGSDAILPRHDNCIWHQLAEDRLWASFIADGHHLPPSALKCMLRAKTPSRSVLVTDAIAAAGMPPGRYRLGYTEVERTPTGRVVLPGTPYLAGSAADMPQCIGKAVLDGGVTFLEAVAMASIRPAMLLPGWKSAWGCFGGNTCDLVELDWRPGDGAIHIRQVALGPFALRATPCSS